MRKRFAAERDRHAGVGRHGNEVIFGDAELAQKHAGGQNKPIRMYGALCRLDPEPSPLTIKIQYRRVLENSYILRQIARQPRHKCGGIDQRAANCVHAAIVE